MPAGDARFRWRLLGPIYLLAVLPRSHRWGRRATLEIEELDDAPLLFMRRDFGSREWFDAACHIAQVRPRVLLESGAPPTLVALAQVGYGIAIVPSSVRVPRGGVRAMPIVRRGEPIGSGRVFPGTRGDSWRRTPRSSSRTSSAYARRARPWPLFDPAAAAPTAPQGAGGRVVTLSARRGSRLRYPPGRDGLGTSPFRRGSRPWER